MKADSGIGDAVALADGVRGGRVAAAEAMVATLDAVSAGNPELNAFVFLTDPDELIAAAADIDRKVALGDDPGPFAGVPMGVKDLEDVRGMPTTHGSLLAAGEPAARDSRQVARLRAAGAIPVGKTNTPEFGYSLETRNRRFGQTRNPRDPARSPGGSSGGSAAAVAAGMVPIATGSDGGGSIRIPAAFCALPGLKPTAGLIPREPDAWGDLVCLGVLSRSVRDVARFLDVVADPSPAPSLEAAISAPLRLETVRAIATVDLDGAVVDEDVLLAFLAALDRLCTRGMQVTVREAPLRDSRHSFAIIASHGDARALARWSDEERAKLSRGFLAWCERGSGVTPAELAAAKADRATLATEVDRLLEEADLILSPTVGVQPWPLGERWVRDPMGVLLTHPFNLTGHPAITVPLPGLLAGLQAAGRRSDEGFLLSFADAAIQAFEEGSDTR